MNGSEIGKSAWMKPASSTLLLLLVFSVSCRPATQNAASPPPISPSQRKLELKIAAAVEQDGGKCTWWERRLVAVRFSCPYDRDKEDRTTRKGDFSLADLAGATHLQSLSLPHDELTGDDLASIGNITSLTHLELWESTFENSSFEHLGRLANLQHIDLDGSQISDDGLAHLSKLKRLNVLSLDSTKVGDAGLAHLQKTTSLKVVYLEVAPVVWTADGVV